MMLGRDFLKKLAIIVFITASITLFGLPVIAATPQENPDTAAVVFNGVSLFQLYSGTLDSVLAKNQQDIITDIQVSPFANVPPAVVDSFNNFLSSAGNLCGLIIGLDTSVSNMKLLLQESGFVGAAQLNAVAFTNLAIAEENLSAVSRAVSIAGNQFKVSGAAPDSSISIAYAAVQDDISRLSDLLDLYRSLLRVQQTEIVNERLISSSEITINIKQSEAYVGDTVDIDGTLSANGQSLANRSIEILIGGSRYLTVTTDSAGHYFGSLQVPYRYVSVIQIQSLYFPQAGDIGNYDLALSPSINLNVLFYTAILTLQTGPNDYPGRDIVVNGQFSYGSNPFADTRHIEISLDNILVSESDVSAVFAWKIALPADTAVGVHLITISVTPNGRFGPVVASINLTVAKSIPVVLTANTPLVIFIPGSFTVRGKVTSDIGPLPQANITIVFEGRNVNALSGDDGSFSAVIKSNMGFGLFGSQSMQITAAPAAPWQTIVITSHNVFAVYVVNCGIFFLILVFLGIIVPRRFKFRIKLGAKTGLPQDTSAAPATVPIIAGLVETDAVSLDVIGGEANTPVGRLFYWYRIVIRLVQRISGLHLKPNQTLREYINNTGQATGTASAVFLEFTRVVEKVLYSPHRVTEDDIKNGEQLARKMRESIGK
jgi:Domain of unknown function (DUF4129)